MHPWCNITMPQCSLLGPPAPFSSGFPVLVWWRLLSPDERSEAVWKSRWPYWAFRPNEPYGSCGRKAMLNCAHALGSGCRWYVNRHPRTLSNTMVGGWGGGGGGGFSCGCLSFILSFFIQFFINLFLGGWVGWGGWGMGGGGGIHTFYF